MSPIMILRLFIILRIVSFIFIDTILIGIFSIIGALYKLLGPTTYINEDDNKLVILIHGSGTSHWQWLVAKFYMYIFGVSFVSVQYNYLQSIKLSCDDVVEQILPLLQSDRKIILIGHSQGGLIARSIFPKINPQMLFLLHTPQKGASILNCLYPETNEPTSSNDMRLGSKFIKNLYFPIIKHAYEVVGINDFVRHYECIDYGMNVYTSWFGHYFSAVNPYLWITHIIPIIKTTL